MTNEILKLINQGHLLVMTKQLKNNKLHFWFLEEPGTKILNLNQEIKY